MFRRVARFRRAGGTTRSLEWARWTALGLLAVAAIGAWSACSSSSGGSAQCNANPWSCAAGTTCWPATCTCAKPPCDSTTCTPQFACLPSLSKQPGEACQDNFGVKAASCGDQQACVAFADAGTTAGVCSSYCDPSHACPDGFACQSVSVGLAQNAPVESVCIALPPEGGVDFDGGTPPDSGFMPDVNPGFSDAQ